MGVSFLSTDLLELYRSIGGVFRSGTGFVWKFRFTGLSRLDLHERFQEAVVLVMEPRLIAIEQRERTVAAGERIECNGEAVILGHVVIVAAEALFLILHAVFEESGFDARVARDAPMGGGELMDEIGLRFGLGAEVVEVIAELSLVFVGGFVEEDDGAGGESVSDGVEGGGLFASVGGGASGFGGVGAGGGDFAVRGRHGVCSPSIKGMAAN
jgi:hypothetical protein